MNRLFLKPLVRCVLPALVALVLGPPRASGHPSEASPPAFPPIPPPLDDAAPNRSLRQPESVLPLQSEPPAGAADRPAREADRPIEAVDGTGGRCRGAPCGCGDGPACLLPLCGGHPFCKGGHRWPLLRLPELHPDRWFRYGSRDGRDIGRGNPLVTTSWLNRPLHFDWFVGGLFGDDLITNQVQQGTDFFGGYRLGADLDHYWGTELRVGWGQLNASNLRGPPRTRRSDVFLSDLSILYYPWGDARWRPYAQLGLGVANFDFVDHNGFGRNETLIGMPIGGGVKFQFRRWLAVRVEVLDNMAFGGDRLSTMHNVTMNVGCEIHWGARRPSYWPWHPSRHRW